ncbi:unnamed protein product [Schistocephalus solidus]|uniref:Uncharacterized protein n=1 Tax=Schistocephalus solidus TaxID=70667 RepID=A0A183TFE1_SCHSO|nr:unnamed protein product [Schistocephalus solidus]
MEGIERSLRSYTTTIDDRTPNALRQQLTSANPTSAIIPATPMMETTTTPTLPYHQQHVHSMPTCLHCAQIFTSRIGPDGQLGISRAHIGVPVPGAQHILAASAFTVHTAHEHLVNA